MTVQLLGGQFSFEEAQHSERIEPRRVDSDFFDAIIRDATASPVNVRNRRYDFSHSLD